MRSWRMAALAAGVASLASVAVAADVVTFNFAQVGQSLLFFLPGDSPLVGQRVTNARIYLDVESFPGSNAANFFTDIAFPISPDPNNTNFFSLLGEDEGWSGAGQFSYFEETTRFNGEFIPTRYGAETPGFDFDGEILEGSRIEFDVVPEPTTAMLLGLAALAGLRRR